MMLAAEFDADGVEVEPVDWVPTSSTESTAMKATDGDRLPPVDEVHRMATGALRKLKDAARLLQESKDILDRWERLRSIVEVDDPPYCWIAQVVVGLPWDPLWKPEHRTSFKGYLPAPLDEERSVSAPMYRFVRYHKRMPTKDEAIGLLQRGMVRVHG
jgi:hypothetical protein